MLELLVPDMGHTIDEGIVDFQVEVIALAISIYVEPLGFKGRFHLLWGQLKNQFE